MYHEVTTQVKSRRRKHALMAVLALVLVIVAIVLAVNAVGKATREQGAMAIRQSILDAALRCCAIEGSYPLTLSHLENDYGLRINHTDYIITYEAYASNIAPSVVVVPR